MTHPNEDIIRAYVGAFARGDLEIAKGFQAGDIVYHVGGRHPLAGEYRGIDDVIQFFNVAPHDLLANDTHGVALAEASAVRHGRTYASKVTTVHHVARGKVTDCWIQDSPEQVANEALA